MVLIFVYTRDYLFFSWACFFFQWDGVGGGRGDEGASDKIITLSGLSWVRLFLSRLLEKGEGYRGQEIYFVLRMRFSFVYSRGLM